MLRSAQEKRGSLQLLLYDLHMRYAEKVHAAARRRRRRFYSEEEEQREDEEFAEAVVLTR
jgi:hypothetical protein